MAERRLSDAAIASGQQFLSKLDEFGFRPESVGWIYANSLDEWRYIVATSGVDIVGRRKVYGAILDLFEAFDFGEGLTESDVHLVSLHEHWYAVMRTFFSTNSTMVFEGCEFNGEKFDAYIYRFNAPPKEADVARQLKSFQKSAAKALEHAQR